MSKELTQARLKELLHYNPETGVFTSLVLRGCNKYGQAIGSCANPDSYQRIWVDRKQYLAHRLAFLYMTGSWPSECMDHINSIRGDNRWVNLREATRLENNQHTGAKRPHKLVGAYQDKRRAHPWYSRITAFGVTHFLGRFSTAEEAHNAYCQAAQKHFGEFFKHTQGANDG